MQMRIGQYHSLIYWFAVNSLLKLVFTKVKFEIISKVYTSHYKTCYFYVELHVLKLIAWVGVLDQKPIPWCSMSVLPIISSFKTSSMQCLTCDYFISV